MKSIAIFFISLLLINTMSYAVSDAAIAPVQQQHIQQYAERIARDVKIRKALLVSALAVTGVAIGTELYSLKDFFAEKKQDYTSTISATNTPLKKAEWFSQVGSWVLNAGKNILGIMGMAVMYEFMSYTMNDAIKHIMYTESIGKFDEHCSRLRPLMQQMQEDIHKVISYHKEGRRAMIDQQDLLCVCNRLVARAEKLLGYMSAKSKLYEPMLKHEARGIMQRMVDTINLFAQEVGQALTASDIDYNRLAQLFEYYEDLCSNEINHFSFVEEDYQEGYVPIIK